MKWIRLTKALEITGHPNRAALHAWCKRWNADTADAPELKILLRPGYVEQESLETALRNIDRPRRCNAEAGQQRKDRKRANENNPILTGRNRPSI